VKIRVAECGKWACDKCRTERSRVLEEKLQDAVQEIDTQRRKKKSLEEKLRLATEGREVGNTLKVQGHPKRGECLVLGDSIIRNVGIECPDIKVGCFRPSRQSSYKELLRNGTLETKTYLSSM